MSQIKNKSPKILFLDIETAPALGWVWGKWEQNVIEFEAHWYILGFSAKWSNGNQITKGLIDYPLYKKDKENDFALVHDIWKLFEEADVIVAHNGDEFDIKKCNARFAFHQLNPPAPYTTVDTKKVAKRHFAFTSNSLDDLGEYLEIGRKIHTGGFELWKGCMEGNKNSWKKMKEYNAQDVILLEKIYLQFLPWMKQGPNHGSYLQQEVCPHCGSKKLQSRGTARTLTSVYQRFQCMNCGGWGRGVKREESFSVVKSM